jgi:DNA-binding CsgD family transcriptional regulator
MTELNEELSEREIEILRLVATGAANKEIATSLSISPNTVKVHLRNIFTKVGVVSRTEATLYAIRQGIVSSPYTETAPDPEIIPLPDSPMALSIPLADEQTPRLLLRKYAWVAALAGIILVALLVYTGLTLVKPAAALPMLPSVTPTQLSRWETDTFLPEKRTGMGAAVYEGAFYLIAGETDTGITNHTQEYDPVARTWKALASKPTAVTAIHAVVLGEKIYVPGGKMAAGEPTDILEVYDPRQNSWSSAARLPVALSNYALASFEGNLYLFGGWDGRNAVSSIFQYDPDQDQWKKRSDLPAALMDAAAVPIENKILVIGGFSGQVASPHVQAYIPSRDHSGGGDPWESAPDLPTGRYSMAGVALANNVYLIGGQESPQGSQELAPWVLVAGSKTWQPFDHPANNVGANPAAVVSGNFIHIFGGRQQQSISSQHIKYQALYTIAVPLISGSGNTP